jgi:iron complex transport system substrate-binding protein
MTSLGLRVGAIALLFTVTTACTAADDPTAGLSAVLEPDEAAIASAPRVVALTSLTADLTEQLQPQSLVGIPGSSLLMEDRRFADIETVSSGRMAPNLETIVSLNPDLVVGAAGFHEQTAERLEELGIQTLLTHVNSWRSLRQLTEDLATILEVDAAPILQRYDACLAQATETDHTALVLVSRQPILSPNQESWAGDFLAMFNIRNLAATLQEDDSGAVPGQTFRGYVSLSAERIIVENPDILLVVDTDEGTLKQFESDAFWGELKAAQAGDVYSMEYHGLINPGSLGSIEATCNHLAQITR